MRTNEKRTGRIARTALAALLVAAAGSVAGCSDVLKVSNPGAIDAANLANANYINLMTNGVVGEFQQMKSQVDMYSGVFSDELRNSHVYFENQNIDLRSVGDNNGTYGLGIYNAIHRVRFLADSSVGRIKNLLGDSAKRDLRMARILAYGGYSYVYLGEQLCGSPVNVSKLYTDNEILAMALPRFDEAIAVATAAKAWAQSAPPNTTPTSMTAYANGADSIINFARVGAARAALDLNDKAKAITYASAVTPVWTGDATTARGFQFWSQYLENSVDNVWWSAAATAAGSGSRSVSMRYTPFENVVDPRVPHQRLAVMDGSNDGTVVGVSGVQEMMAPSSFNNWNPTTAQEITKSSWIRIASSIEALYILAEAQGPTTANLAFINNRRAVAGMPALDASVSQTAFRDAVIEQRAREFFADGHRIGDIRRYKKYYGLNFWPTGNYPGSATGLVYGTDECWPLPVSEKTMNPNLGS